MNAGRVPSSRLRVGDHNCDPPSFSTAVDHEPIVRIPPLIHQTSPLSSVHLRFPLSSGVMTERKQRGSETKTYILTKAVGVAYGDNGLLFTKLLDAVGGT